MTSLTRHLDVYYVPDNLPPGTLTCSVSKVCKSWDESLYIETNVKGLAGHSRRITLLSDGTMFISGGVINGGLMPNQVSLFNAG